MPLVGDPADWAGDTQQGVIYAALRQSGDDAHIGTRCPVCSTTYSALVDLLGNDPLRFYRNPVGDEEGRQELPRGKERARKLLNKIREVHAYVGAADRADVIAQIPATPAPVVTVNSDHACQAAAEGMLRWIQRELRPFCEARNADGQPFDQIGLRPAQGAAKMLTAGVDERAIKHALTLHYPASARKELGVKPFDPTTFAPREWGGVTAPKTAAQHGGKHRALPYVVALAQAGVPIALVGPPGTGKTHLAQQLADELGIDFGFMSMTRGTSPSAFYGRPKIGSDGMASLITAMIARGDVTEALALATANAQNADVTESEFSQIIRNGGVWLFDEMDAAEPNLLLIANAPLANRKFANTATGETIIAHDMWVPVAAMNTLGLGGDRKMTGRAKQDGAALDRWNAGRVEIALDTELESAMFWKAVAA